MAKNKRLKALVMGAVAMTLSCSMLVGTTFAWFTDSVTSSNNVIKSGNLDVELEYMNSKTTSWTTVDENTNVFQNALWEPGHTEVVYLKVSNVGSLAFKYKLGVNVASETPSTNVYGDPFELSDYIYFDVTDQNGEVAKYTREQADAEKTETTTISMGYADSGKLAASNSDYMALIVYMPETTGNVVNHAKNAPVPTINLGINLVATQVEAEEDSFGNDYDAKASVSVAPGESIANAIASVEDGGVVFLENGVHNVASGPITIENKTVTIIGLGEVTINKNYGSTHIFTVKNGANVTIENVNMDGKGNTREGIYVRWNSVVTLKDVTIKNTGGLDVMIDEASDAMHGQTTASYVWLYNSHIEDVAMCASPVTTVAATQDTFVYFNYDDKSTVESINVQNINTKPENVIINGVASNEVGTTKQLYVSNDAELTAALNTIKTNEAYWNKQVYVYLAAGEYSADHVINQYPQWNGISGRGTGNNYDGGVPAGAPNTVITFVGETASTYGLRGAQTVPTVTFTGNVTVNGFADSMAGMDSAVAVTNFQNVAFDAENSIEANGKDYIAMYVTAAASNVNFDGCVFTGATHVTLGGSTPNGIGNVSFNACTFDNGGCLSGYPQKLTVTGCVVTRADNGFINVQSGGSITVEDSTVNAGEYFVRTRTGVEINVTGSDITMYESNGSKHLVYFRGSGEEAYFVDCTIADGYTVEGVDEDSTLSIYNYTETEEGLVLKNDGITGQVTLSAVPKDYAFSTLTVPHGVTNLGSKILQGDTTVKEVVIPATVTDFGGTPYETGTGASGGMFYQSAVEKVVLPEGMTEIPAATFNQAANLKEVNIPSTVTSIGINAFAGSGLEKLTIPATVTEIGYGAFRDMGSLTEITIEGDVYIPSYAFRACANLKDVYLTGKNVTFGDNMIFTVTSTNNENPNGITVHVANPVVKARLEATNLFKGTIECPVVNEPENGVYVDATTGDSYAFPGDNAELNDVIKEGAATVYLDDGNYIIPDSAKGQTLKIVGNGNTNIATQDDGSYEGCDYSLDGATVVFENITITTNSATYTGYARLNATYNNCTINGTYTLYGNSEFNNCTFNVSGDVYNIWTWGAPNATFNNCTFNSDGKAILLYGTVDTNLTVNGCVFNDKGGLADLKAAIEIGNDYNKSYTLTVTNTKVNGYEINDKGINTGTTLWANKNSMGTDKLNVVVDGVDVY